MSKARAAIERLMWQHDSDPYSVGDLQCVGCFRLKSYGEHKPDCWVMAALAELDQLERTP
jgi:hypothetical protein